MPSRRLERIAAAIKQCASETILYKMKDPRCGFVTVTRVDVTADLRHAKLYVSVMAEPPQQRNTLRALDSARGFIQTAIAHRLNTRFTPHITIQLDETPAKSIEISRLIDQAIAEDQSRHPDATTTEAPETEPEE